MEPIADAAMTNEFRAAGAATVASGALDELARALRAVGSPQARAHANEAAGAARLAREWSAELLKLHRTKRRDRRDELTDAELADCGLLSELDG